ncbi:hypothetical protein [Treponema sp.]
MSKCSFIISPFSSVSGFEKHCGKYFLRTASSRLFGLTDSFEV